MMKRLFFLFFVLGFSVCVMAADYSVVLKSGKTMKGTLVSETADMIIFKDSTGVQFSLKKTSLDLAKMAELNQPEPEPPAQSQPAGNQPKKSAKMYTADDIDKMREKYGDLGMSQTTRPVLPGDMAAADYYNAIREAAEALKSTAQDVARIGDEIVLHQNANEDMDAYMSNNQTVQLMNGVNKSIDDLTAAKSQLSNPPDGFDDAYTGFGNALDAVIEYYNAAKESNVDKRGSELTDAVSSMLQPVMNLTQPPPPEQAPPPQE